MNCFRFPFFFRILFFVLSFPLVSKAQNLLAPSLQCVNVLSNNDIVLTWATPPPDGCGMFTGYVIYGSGTGVTGPYAALDTITNQAQTTFTLSGLTGPWFFYMISIYYCAGFTSLSSDTLDTALPLPPVIDYVTVQSSNQVLIQFQPSTSPEAYAYIIYEVISGANFPIDTIYDGMATQYIHSINTSGVMHSYVIATMDSCGNTGLISTLVHNTIVPGAMSINCSTSGKLIWSRYHNWTGGVDHYDVFVSINSQPSMLLISVQDSVANFVYGADSMCFIVVAYSANGLFSSSSDVLCLPPNPSSPVQDFYIRNVTVAEPGVIAVYYSINKNSDIRSMKIYRGTDSTLLSAISVLLVPDDLDQVNIYFDSSALTSQISYYYRLQAIDSCGVESFSSIGNSIWLDGGAYSSQINHINWDLFYLQYGNVTHYDIYRKQTAVFDSIASVTSVTNYFEESVASLVDENGTLCYYVTATDTLRLPNGITDTVVSVSNPVCIDQIVKMIVPNAFAPNGVNNIFKPVMRFADNKSYLFVVFNRWGGEVFLTHDINEGWDGTYNGRPAVQGTYGYLVQVVDDRGNTTERKGTVILLK